MKRDGYSECTLPSDGKLAIRHGRGEVCEQDGTHVVSMREGVF
jgi:hypothetical protein